jgi:alkaline phosphatase D
MKQALLTGLLLSCVLSGCAQPQKPDTGNLQVIAFGSCNKQDKDQSFWHQILSQQPDLWVWLGDNIYADTADMQVMADKYARQLNNPDYQKFVTGVPVTGIWDDHDYGMNDGNRHYPMKVEAKQQFMNFMGIDERHPMNDHPGIYHSRLYGTPPNQVKLIMLDTRTFQDPLAKTPRGSTRNYVPHPTGTLLGEAQWQWLERELHQSTAQVNLIASSLQVIAEDHKYEMWANFPNERKRLLDLLVDSQVSHPVILSGDRHLSEISQLNWRGQILTDITSSGLTHSFSGNWEDNRHRQGALITDESFSLLLFDWSGMQLTIRQLDMNQQVLNQLSLAL